MKEKKQLDLPQAVVVSAVLGSALIAVGMVLTWGPDDSRSQVMEWVAGAMGIAGTLYASMRSRSLFGFDDGKPEDDDAR